MQLFFDNLSNIGLRRLFKFVVKRAIGKYLENELMIDQLTVHSRDGVMSLRGLSMDCDVLNTDFCANLPFKLVSCSLDSLEAKVSYRSLLSDGFHFLVKGVHIVIENNVAMQNSKYTNASKKRQNATSTQPATARAEESTSTTSGDLDSEVSDGVAFIANWLDVLVAGLRVSIEDLNVTFQVSCSLAERSKATSFRSKSGSQNYPSNTEEIGIRLHIDTITFQNSLDIPDLSRQETSVSMTSRILSDVESSSMLGARKCVTFSSFSGQMFKRVLVNGRADTPSETSFDLFDATEDITVNFSTYSKTPALTVTSLDVNIPHFALVFTPITIVLCLRFYTKFFGNTQNTAAVNVQQPIHAPVDTLQWLEQSYGRSESTEEIDVVRIINYLKMKRLNPQLVARTAASMPSSLDKQPIAKANLSRAATQPFNDDEVEVEDIESDGEIANDDDDDDDEAMDSLGETQYFDPNSAKSVRWDKKASTAAQSKLLNASAYGKSASSMGSAMFYSVYDPAMADDVFVSRSSAKHTSSDISKCDYRFRMTIGDISIRINNNSSSNNSSSISEGAVDEMEYARLLVLDLTELVVDVQAVAMQPKSVFDQQSSSSSNSSVDSTMALDKVCVYLANCILSEHEKRRDNEESSERVLFAIDTTLQQGEISVGSGVEMNIKYLDKASKQQQQRQSISLDVMIRPLWVSLHLDCIGYWSKLLSCIDVPCDGERSTIDMKATIKCRSIDVVVHSYNTHPQKRWNELANALDLQNTIPSEGVHIPSPWTKLKIAAFRPSNSRTPKGVAIPFDAVLMQSKGGFRFTFNEVSVNYQTQTDSADATTASVQNNQNKYVQLLRVGTFTGKLFLLHKSLSFIEETVIISASQSPTSTEGISLETTSFNGNVNSHYNNKKTGSNLKKLQLGFDPPNCDSEQILYLKADILEIDIAQREYCAVLAMVSFFSSLPASSPSSYSSSTSSTAAHEFASSFSYGATPNRASASSTTRTATSAKNASQTVESGFGFVLSANVAIIRIKSSDDFTCAQCFHRFAFDGNPLHSILKEVFPDIDEDKMDSTLQIGGNDLSDPYVICASVRGIVLETLSFKSTTYVAASALDIALYETTESQLSADKIDSFADAPIFFRSSLIHNISSHSSSSSSSNTAPEEAAAAAADMSSSSSPRDGWVVIGSSVDEFGMDRGDSRANGVYRSDHINDNSNSNSNSNQNSATTTTVYIDPKGLSTLLHESVYITDTYHSSLLPLSSSSIRSSSFHTILIQALIVEAPSVVDPKEVTQDITIHLDFKEITYNFNAYSNWINRIVSLVTPIRPETVLERRKKIKSKAYELQSIAQSLDQSALLAALGNTNRTTATASTATAIPIEPDEDISSSPLPFALTKVSINVTNCLIDLKSIDAATGSGGRLLLSVGSIAVASTIASSSPLFAVKLSLDEIDLFVTKFVNNNNEDLSLFAEQRALRIDGTLQSRQQPSNATTAAVTDKFGIELTSDSHSNASLFGSDSASVKLASDFLDLHQFVPLLSLTKSTILVTFNNRFGTARDPFILHSVGTLFSSSEEDSNCDRERDSKLKGQQLIAPSSMDADDENVNGFSAVAIVMSLKGCNFEARLDTIDLFVTACNATMTNFNAMLSSLRPCDYDWADAKQLSALTDLAAETAAKATNTHTDRLNELAAHSAPVPSAYIVDHIDSQRGNDTSKGKTDALSWMNLIEDDAFAPLSHQQQQEKEKEKKKVIVNTDLLSQSMRSVNIHNKKVNNNSSRPETSTTIKRERKETSINEDDEFVEGQGRWLPLFDYDNESCLESVGGEDLLEDGFEAYDDDDDDDGVNEDGSAHVKATMQLTDSDPHVLLFDQQNDRSSTNNSNNNESNDDDNDEDDETVRDVKFVPEFEFQDSDFDDDDDDDEDDNGHGDPEAAGLGYIKKRGESTYGLAAFSTLMYEGISSRLARRAGKGKEEEVELESFSTNRIASVDSEGEEEEEEVEDKISSHYNNENDSDEGVMGDEQQEEEKANEASATADAVQTQQFDVTVDDDDVDLDAEAEGGSPIDGILADGNSNSTELHSSMYNSLPKTFAVAAETETEAIASRLQMSAGVVLLSNPKQQRQPRAEQRVHMRQYDTITEGHETEDYDYEPEGTAARTVEGEAEEDAMAMLSTMARSDQAARWLVNTSEIIIKEHYIPYRFREKRDIPTRELAIRPRLLFTAEANIHFRILAGFDWPSEELLLAKVLKAEDDVDLVESELPNRRKSTAAATKTGKEAAKQQQQPFQRRNSKTRSLLFELTDGNNNIKEDKAAATAHSTQPGVGKTRHSLFEPANNVQLKGRSAVPRRNADVKRFSRDNEDCIGLHAKALSVALRYYGTHIRSSKSADSSEENEREKGRDSDHSREQIPSSAAPTAPKAIPDLRMAIGVGDLLVWMAAKGTRKRKVIGKLRSDKAGFDGIPSSASAGSSSGSSANSRFISITTTGYDVSKQRQQQEQQHTADMEYRVAVAVQPIRLYLNAKVIDFVKVLAECQECIDIVSDRTFQSKQGSSKDKRSSKDRDSKGTGNASSSTNAMAMALAMSSSGESIDMQELGSPSSLHAAPIRTGLYIQFIAVSDIEVVVDYQPSIVSVEKLQEGDFSQLLNFFPLEDMKLTLKAVRFTAVSSIGKFLASAGEQWVKDIYEHQMLRVLSGAAPLKALSNIGSGLQDLFVTPLAEYHKSLERQQQYQYQLQQRQQRLRVQQNPDQQSGDVKKSSQTNSDVAKALKKTTVNLIQTVSRETLDASHKITMLLARGIESLATGTESTMRGRSSAPTTATSGRSASTASSSRLIGSTSSLTRTSNHNNNRPMKHRSGSGADGHGAVLHRKIGDEWESQPVGVVDGFQRGMDSLSRELSSAMDIVVTVPLRTYRRTGSKGQYLREVITALPIALLRPLAGTAEAMSYTLLGLRNNVDPRARADEEDLWQHSLEESLVLKRS